MLDANEATALNYWTLAIALVGGITGVAALVTQVWGLVLAGPRVVGILGSVVSARIDAASFGKDVERPAISFPQEGDERLLGDEAPALSGRGGW